MRAEALFRDHNSPETPKPLPVIHSDLSPTGAEFTKREAQEALLASEDPEHVAFGKQMSEKHVLIVNTWKPLHTVRDNHLGFCKWNSLSKEDAIKSTITITDSETALQPWRYRKGQEWFYLSQQEKDEVYVFMQHDSRAGHGINVPHASFTFKEDRNKPSTRMSFESVIIALVE
ncbi:uncharacterized protein MELLADRAFT_70524 [Melampsora larici-populina 98AG31]|uniref:Uncharacterized protein n=1 Tax=Melampsora larici-populina (strain 98AG31 / pathotype 3-4-7) TaxID=747676 RepID=F4R4L1_MELLP|nr:uncharacterized protein MELLADRAFT_70524 [Melampsora larici-populina 98AG31]EGG12980.1 hypothetical protein MELLADRAFT_70524 [Melampsora larici-populina 98AG31]